MQHYSVTTSGAFLSTLRGCLILRLEIQEPHLKQQTKQTKKKIHQESGWVFFLAARGRSRSIKYIVYVAQWHTQYGGLSSSYMRHLHLYMCHIGDAVRVQWSLTLALALRIKHPVVHSENSFVGYGVWGMGYILYYLYGNRAVDQSRHSMILSACD